MTIDGAEKPTHCICNDECSPLQSIENGECTPIHNGVEKPCMQNGEDIPFKDAENGA